MDYSRSPEQGASEFPFFLPLQDPPGLPPLLLRIWQQTWLTHFLLIKRNHTRGAVHCDVFCKGHNWTGTFTRAPGSPQLPSLTVHCSCVPHTQGRTTQASLLALGASTCVLHPFWFVSLSLSLSISLSLPPFFETRVWIQGFALAKQALYPMPPVARKDK
jgi:hypothetical protein